MGDGALFVIGLHGSGDGVTHFLQDWEVAKEALSCHVAFDMLCQGMRSGKETWLVRFLNEPVV